MSALLNKKNIRESIEDIIRQYYNGLRITKTVGDGSGGGMSYVEMFTIKDLKILSVSENVAKIAVRFRWKDRDYGISRNDSGVASIEQIGLSYRVINFE